MNKKKVIVLSVIGLVVFCMLAGMTACTAVFVNELEREAELEEQRIEQQLEQPKEEEQPVIEDEYLNEDDLGMIELPGQPAPEESHIQQGRAYEVVAPYVDEAFGPTGLNYYLTEEVIDGETVVILMIDISHAEVEVAAQDGTWNEISDLGVLASESMYNVLLANGVDAHFEIVIGDMTDGFMYYCAIDGELVTDIPNGVQ